MVSLTYSDWLIERTVYDYQEIVQPLGHMYKTSIDVNITIPFNQEVKYMPGVLESIKYAWIQYLSIFLPVIYLYWAAVKFLLKYKVLETSVVSELHKKKIF